MTFILAGHPDKPNPVIPMQAGERIRLVLRNEAPGLLHDVQIPAWNIAIPEIQAGDSGETVFVVPGPPGRYEYRCRPHAEMMHGLIEVTEALDSSAP